ncbi:MAG: hypothetical protein EOM19_05960 [Candidatus Moranbacteria bacterium]|nr:hypothetical protein [Candidatus Moranbacteria bacterium]
MQDLLHKILCAIEIHSPSLSWENVSSFPKELGNLLYIGILTKRRTLHAVCKQCYTPCEIQKMGNESLIIYCENCEYPRIANISENEIWEYHINIRVLLSFLLDNIGYENKNIIENTTTRSWSLGTHILNESPRLFLFITCAQYSDENLLSYLKQNQHLKPIVFSPITQLSTHNTAVIPLDTILTQKGKSFFSKTMFRNIVGNKGITSSVNCLYLGENNAICIEKKKVLFNLNSLGEYEDSGEITEITFNMISFLVNASKMHKNTWKSREELSKSFHCQKNTISNKMSEVRRISKKIGIELIEQHQTTKKFRINPDLIVQSSSLTSSLKNRF